MRDKPDEALILPHSTIAEAKPTTIQNATTVLKSAMKHESLYMNENASSQPPPKAKWKPRGRGRGRGKLIQHNDPKQPKIGAFMRKKSTESEGGQMQ